MHKISDFFFLIFFLGEGYRADAGAEPMCPEKFRVTPPEALFGKLCLTSGSGKSESHGL